MLKRLVALSVVLILAYVGFVNVQIRFLPKRFSSKRLAGNLGEDPHTVYRFSFSKYMTTGERQLEIEGDSANILGHEVQLTNVIAKAYAEETPVVVTADRGIYDKQSGIVHLNENVVATTDSGARLLTEELDIVADDKRVESPVLARVKTENIDVVGTEAVSDSKISNVQFKKNVTVSFRDPKNTDVKPTVVTCDGILDIDYGKNIARFNKNVVAVDSRGTLKADRMDVIYDKDTEELDRMIGIGNVEIIKPDGSSTLSDSVVYFAMDGRVLLGGDPEVMAYEDEKSDSLLPFDTAASPGDDKAKPAEAGSDQPSDANPQNQLPSFVSKGII
ncbi:MAG: LPS export ABC transporter periplasmic protein LptC [Candidatus Omnitrophica bacterium]|nr:LPS export ABC transporter periplasmic protein LptC [Candidatus Omnitrophota bacterium]